MIKFLNNLREKLLNNLRQWLMLRYCPDYEKNMPEDKPGVYCAEAVISTGYWGNNYRTVAAKAVNGLKQAYIESRWLALTEQWRRPAWLFDCGIHYSVRALDERQAGIKS